MGNKDCFIEIFSFLNYINLLKLKTVCTYWKHIIENTIKKIRIKKIKGLTDKLLVLKEEKEGTKFETCQNILTIIYDSTKGSNLIDMINFNFCDDCGNFCISKCSNKFCGYKICECCDLYRCTNCKKKFCEHCLYIECEVCYYGLCHFCADVVSCVYKKKKEGRNLLFNM